MGVAKKHFRFQVGDQVAFLYGPRMVRGEIIENRGPFGVYGDQVYLVRTALDSEGMVAIEVQEQDLEEATAADEHEGAPGPRRAYRVTYIRQQNSNTWKARITRGRIYKGVRARGAVAYTSGRWEGETREDEKHAIVSVYLEPHEDESEQKRQAEARKLSDRMFTIRHPEAVIIHEEQEGKRGHRNYLSNLLTCSLFFLRCPGLAAAGRE